jgi:hypothetical protein
MPNSVQSFTQLMQRLQRLKVVKGFYSLTMTASEVITGIYNLFSRSYNKKKAESEKAHHDKFQRFHQQCRAKLHNLHRDFEKSMDALGEQCFDYPHTGGTISNIIDWFEEEVQTLPVTFADANKNITCSIVVGILKMLTEVGCEHIPELWKLAVSSMLHCCMRSQGIWGR